MATIRGTINPIAEILTAGKVIHSDAWENEPAYYRSFNPATAKYSPATFRNKQGILSKKIVLNTSGTSESYIKQSHKNPLVLNAKLRGSDATTMYKNLRDLLLVVPMQCTCNLKLQNMDCSFLQDNTRERFEEICDTFKPETAYTEILDLIREKIDCSNICTENNRIYLKNNKDCFISCIPPRNHYKEGELSLYLADVEKYEELKPLVEIFDILLAFFASEGENVRVKIQDKRTPNKYFQNKVEEYAEYHKEDTVEKVKGALSKIVSSLYSWDNVYWSIMRYAEKDANGKLVSDGNCANTLFPIQSTLSNGITSEWTYYIPKGYESIDVFLEEKNARVRDMFIKGMHSNIERVERINSAIEGTNNGACGLEALLDANTVVREQRVEESRDMKDLAMTPFQQALLQKKKQLKKVESEESLEAIDPIAKKDAQNIDNRGALSTRGVSLGGGASVVPVLPS